MKIAKVSAREKNKRTPHTASITSNQEHSKIGVDGNNGTVLATAVRNGTESHFKTI